MKMSDSPMAERFAIPIPGSKSTDSRKEPVVKILPLLSMAMEFPPSEVIPPKDFAQIKFPSASIF